MTGHMSPTIHGCKVSCFRWPLISTNHPTTLFPTVMYAFAFRIPAILHSCSSLRSALFAGITR